MNNLDGLSKRRLIAPRKWRVVSFLALSFLGFVDSVYLAAKHYLGGPLNCTISEGCDKVAASAYAVMLGLPLGLWGALYYVAIFLSVIAYLDTRRDWIYVCAAGFTFIGFLFSLWFVYLQIYVIEAICQYCMFSAATSTLLFILAVTSLKDIRRGRMKRGRDE